MAEQMKSTAPVKKRVWRMRLMALGVSLVLGLLLAEGLCQLYSLVLYRQFAQRTQDPRYFYGPSDDPVLVYGLKKDADIASEDGRKMHLNKDGLREDVDRPLPQPERIGIIGDSVAFGLGLSSNVPFSKHLQDRLDPKGERLKVLNFGVPGYSLSEMDHQMKWTSELYQPQTVIYLLNMNDFAMRDTIYDGADDGLYRIYNHPTLKLPWFIGKAIYRSHQGKHNVGTPGWIKWLYEGGKERSLPHLVEMKRLADARGQRFIVITLTVTSAFEGGKYVLEREQSEVAAFAKEHGIELYDWWQDYAEAPSEYEDITDHLTDKGFVKLAERVATLLGK